MMLPPLPTTALVGKTGRLRSKAVPGERETAFFQEELKGLMFNGGN